MILFQITEKDVLNVIYIWHIGIDPWVIQSRERMRYQEQFDSLKPINGIVTGEQAKGFFLRSQLPPPILGQIW